MPIVVSLTPPIIIGSRKTAKLYLGKEDQLNRELSEKYRVDLSSIPADAELGMPIRGQLRVALTEFYEKHNPDKLTDISEIEEYYCSLPLQCLHDDLLDVYKSTIDLSAPDPLQKARSGRSFSGSFRSGIARAGSISLTPRRRSSTEHSKLVDDDEDEDMSGNGLGLVGTGTGGNGSGRGTRRGSVNAFGKRKGSK